jgi:hypothetical protein
MLLYPETKEDMNRIDPTYLFISFKSAAVIYPFDLPFSFFNLNSINGIKWMAI